jgi:hypothetical protein
MAPANVYIRRSHFAFLPAEANVKSSRGFLKVPTVRAKRRVEGWL